MDDTPHHVENEIEDHKADLNRWVSEIEALPVQESRKGVFDRFVRDCKVLINDLETNEIPTMADLVDFTDRRNSLEIQCLNIKSDTK